MIHSMTGFSTVSGAKDEFSWTWDIRSVNARGLDVRLRVPEWVEGLEQKTRKIVADAVGRGNVSVSLKLTSTGEGEQYVDAASLDAALALIKRVEVVALEHALKIAPTSAAQVLMMRGVTENNRTIEDTGPLSKALLAGLPSLLDGFNKMRASEGAELADVLAGQLDKIEALVVEAVVAAEARRNQMADTLKQNLARIMDNSDGVEPQRIAQELAMLAVKADVSEEIDRLRVHVSAARELLTEKGPVGRKLDFLSQEFNREANTLCSKAGAPDLTSIGLELKTVIDQMREQIQNVE